MDLRGFTSAIKLLAAIAVVAIIAIAIQMLGLNNSKNLLVKFQPSVTPTASVEPTIPPTLNSVSDIDAISSEVDKSIDEIDKLQNELDSLDTNLSTTEIDTNVLDLDKVK